MGKSKMSADVALSRIFNIARDMVRPAYVAAETAARKANVAKNTKKPTMMSKGGKAGGKMTLASVRAAAKKMGYKLVKTG